VSNRYSKELLNQINTHSNIVQIIEKAVKLQKNGRNYKGLCPFHNEKTPSFTVSDEKNMYYCFGCHAHGKAIDFYIQYYKLTFVQAVEKLAQELGIDTHQSEDPGLTLLENIKNWCQTQFKLNHKAKGYLHQRALHSDTIDKFSIGFMPTIPINRLCKILSCSINDLIHIGVINPDTQKNRFSNRVIFPIFNSLNQVIAFGGRTLQEDFQPKYINSPETKYFHKRQSIYGLNFIPQKKDLIVVEGYMDVIQLSNYGIHNAVAILGTSFTTEHLQKLIQVASKITLCFDGDGAGVRASLKAAKMCLPLLGPNCEINILNLPDQHDPDSFLSQYSKSAFIELIDNSDDVCNVIIKNLLSKRDMSRAIEKSRYRQELKDHTDQIKDLDFKKSMMNDGLEQLYQRKPVAKILTNIQTSWIDEIIAIIICNPTILKTIEDTQIKQLVSYSIEDKPVRLLQIIVKKVLDEHLDSYDKIIKHCRNQSTQKKLAFLFKRGIQITNEQQQLELVAGIEKIGRYYKTKKKEAIIALSKERKLSQKERDELIKLIEEINYT
tara:strand:- start:14970 stop:16619 length:1650 start_codon:yes stop_codon:yes gene_type:complete